RGEVFGSGGMVTMGDVRRSSMTLFDATGVSNDTWRRDTDHFIQAYTAQLASFVEAARSGVVQNAPTGADARNALAIALAAIESVSKKQPVPVN
ncbi:Gfo/Idh/MocA family oxidoreductase, partial [Agrobacterium deltaense]